MCVVVVVGGRDVEGPNIDREGFLYPGKEAERSEILSAQSREWSKSPLWYGLPVK